MTHTAAKCLSALLLLSASLVGQADPAAPPAEPKTETAAAVKPATEIPVPTQPANGTILVDKRVFGVLPNYRTADGTAAYEPISNEKKLYIGLKDSFDYPIFFTSALYSGLYQLENDHPQFGQGALGYTKRYLTSSTDLIVGNFMTESIFPILLKQDPRYFAVGKAYGGVWKRTGYALTRVFVCKSDQGKAQFNYSEVLGNGVAVAFSNVYYKDSRNVSDNVQSLGMQVGTDAISNVLKEFWPDVKRRFFKKKIDPND